MTAILAEERRRPTDAIGAKPAPREPRSTPGGGWSRGRRATDSEAERSPAHQGESWLRKRLSRHRLFSPPVPQMSKRASGTRGAASVNARMALTASTCGGLVQGWPLVHGSGPWSVVAGLVRHPTAGSRRRFRRRCGWSGRRPGRGFRVGWR